MHLYTLANAQPIPPAENLGNYVRVRRRTDGFAKPTWNVTFENAVGGTIGYRFKTLRDAKAYAAMIVDKDPKRIRQL